VGKSQSPVVIANYANVFMEFYFETPYAIRTRGPETFLDLHEK
jgi:hypothetical protein